MPSDESSQGFTMLNDKWKEIGFQSKNPRTDFRGAGHLGLLCFMYLIEYYPAEFDRMK